MATVCGIRSLGVYRSTRCRLQVLLLLLSLWSGAAYGFVRAGPIGRRPFSIVGKEARSQDPTTRGCLTSRSSLGNEQTRPFRTTALQSSLSTPSPTGSFLVRIAFLRAMAFVHLVAFWIAFRQNKALIGDHGITPARHILNHAQARGSNKCQRRLEWRRAQEKAREDRDNRKKRKTNAFEPIELDNALWTLIGRSSLFRFVMRRIDKIPKLIRLREVVWDRSDRNDRPLPTLLWLAKNRRRLNPWLDGVALSGCVLALSILLLGSANVPMILGLWICQRSLMSVGGVFYAYGWEPQLAELSFHALFLVPMLSLNNVPPAFPIPNLVLWMIKWHLFRIMMGAGLIKVRGGDRKWIDLTAMNYFFQTQPVPNPLTRYFHWMPQAWHKFEVLSNHFVELVAPWLLLLPGLPTNIRRLGGLIQMMFHSFIIASGNLSFLNWMTMVPAIACLDDAFLAPLFSTNTRQAAAVAAAASSPQSMLRRIVSVAFFVAMAQLSVPVIRNLCSKQQQMNGSFDPLRLVNTYGAFGYVQEERDELIIKASSDAKEWKEYEFCVKPGNVHRSPQFLSPYHHRLDWQLWIAACGFRVENSPWLYAFLLKLLEQDEGVRSLIAKDPFENEEEAPKYIRIERYRYQFYNKKQREALVDGEDSHYEGRQPYWDRQLVGRFYPKQGIATKESLKEAIQMALPTD